jgi:hypothetical protein
MDRTPWSELPQDWSDDEKLAGHYLAGWLEKINGRLVHRYFEPGSDDEKAAQAALARCLWDWHNPKRPLLDGIRVRLAALFGGIDLDRKLTLEFRRRPQATRAWIQTLIFESFKAERANGRNFETAVANTVKHIGVSESTVKRALRELPSQRGRKTRSKNKG